MRGLSLRAVPLDAVDWAALDALPDRNVFQRRHWLEFVAATQGARPVAAQLLADGDCVGWFEGLVVKRLGMRILGSPLPGWTTDYLGFNLVAGVSRAAAVAAVPRWAFEQLGCVHAEVRDRHLPADHGSALGRSGVSSTWVVDLRPDEERLYAALASGARQNMRKAERMGLVVEEAQPAGFAAEFYDQLRDVFAKQGLVPTYSESRVDSLISHVHRSGDLQLLRVRTADGDSIATAVIARYGRTAHFWGGASYRAQQVMRPNELLLWHAMLSARRAGAEEFDFAGDGAYKKRYGAERIELPWLRWSRWPVLPAFRGATRWTVLARQRAAGRARARPGPVAAGQPPPS